MNYSGWLFLRPRHGSYMKRALVFRNFAVVNKNHFVKFSNFKFLGPNQFFNQFQNSFLKFVRHVVVFVLILFIINFIVSWYADQNWSSRKAEARSARGSLRKITWICLRELFETFYQSVAWSVIGNRARRSGIIDGAIILNYSVRTFGETLNWSTFVDVQYHRFDNNATIINRSLLLISRWA